MGTGKLQLSRFFSRFNRHTGYDLRLFSTFVLLWWHSYLWSRGQLHFLATPVLQQRQRYGLWLSPLLRNSVNTAARSIILTDDNRVLQGPNARDVS